MTNNPLKEKQKTMTYAEMSRLTGLHRNTLLNISRYDHVQILGMNVGTVIILRDVLGVDMLCDFGDYHLVRSVTE